MRQIAIFIAVGSAAAVTHLTVVALVVELLHLKPLSANVIGFCVAFLVSFGGHARWTIPLHRSVTPQRGRAFSPWQAPASSSIRPLMRKSCTSSGPAIISPPSPPYLSGSLSRHFCYRSCGLSRSRKVSATGAKFEPVATELFLTARDAPKANFAQLTSRWRKPLASRLRHPGQVRAVKRPFKSMARCALDPRFYPSSHAVS